MPLRIVVADYEEVARAGFRFVFQRDPNIDVAGEACDGAEALELVARVRPAILVSDLSLPWLNGIQLAHSLQHRMGHDRPKIVLVARDVTDEQLRLALQARINGLLAKSTPGDEVIRALYAAANGEVVLSPRFTTQLLSNFTIVPVAGREPPADLACLSGRELAVLRGIARGASNSEIGRELDVAEATVKAHASNIFDKLGVRDRVQAAVLAHGAGLVEPLLPDDESGAAVRSPVSGFGEHPIVARRAAAST
jgi:DNA-binding NarL/FixJ family response regulator